MKSELMASQTDSSITVGWRRSRLAVAVLLLSLTGSSTGVAQDTAGSTTVPFRSIQGDPGPPGEAVSPFGDLFGRPEAGSAVIGVDRWPEAGSAIAGSVVYPDREAYRGGTRPPRREDRTRVRLHDVGRLTITLLVALVLVAAAYCLFRIGGRRPHNSDLWSRRMNLASEVAQQMDLFLVAAYREEWDICGKTLAALNDLNGQRTILLGDEANRQVLQFIATAVDCRINRDVADNLPRLRTIQVHALAALREEIGQTGQLSATLMRSLRDTRHLYRSLRDVPSKEQT
ncbi:MAG: hypothetical protein HON53_22235 [Planctomycetaceae bacterium]|nr:hypothetical protein [Planctomycetaceae bacterium]MBT6153238.1 hypothetical protein [Planctomycetaceae bacterium]MBT6486895.1 hypothetical protein [Planctomycetaceae bacterium]MBT6493079.1 hypothetical protein [Planctomycetaceae bacterium]